MCGSRRVLSVITSDCALTPEITSSGCTFTFALQYSSDHTISSPPQCLSACTFLSAIGNLAVCICLLHHNTRTHNASHWLTIPISSYMLLGGHEQASAGLGPLCLQTFRNSWDQTASVTIPCPHWLHLISNINRGDSVAIDKFHLQFWLNVLLYIYLKGLYH